MNRASRVSAIINSQHNPFRLKASLFHSTSVVERRRRTHWNSGGTFRDSSRRFNQYSKRFRKQTLLRNASEFAEHLFQSWQSDSDEEHDQSSSQGYSWFRPHFRADGFKRGNLRNRGTRHFEDEDIEFETIFRTAFGGNEYFYWSQEPGYRNYSRHRFHEEYDSHSSTESQRSEADMISHRLALGLNASGPLNLEDVKNAYRACALKWHPDRHQGSSKVVAAEKFKICNAAYKSLCDKLALN
ncbi:Chaperone DnaJ-domain superfamily protein [Forsythia ovata]|uniref:Chaperone DnaJ-domain superfamily protein n=2 Tax=Forsythia ovata TaxID=205694 RepID=A0ABD1PM96_9LAMI